MSSDDRLLPAPAVQTTPEDVETQKRLRTPSVRNPLEAMQALHDSLPPAARRQSRATASSRSPFEL